MSQKQVAEARARVSEEQNTYGQAMSAGMFMRVLVWSKFSQTERYFSYHTYSHSVENYNPYTCSCRDVENRGHGLLFPILSLSYL